MGDRLTAPRPRRVSPGSLCCAALSLSFVGLSPCQFASAQSVPGFVVEQFSGPPWPQLLSVASDGTVYAGIDTAANGSLVPLFITRIERDGTHAPYGLFPTPDPDPVVFDESGVVGGVPGSVLAGGQISQGGPGRISAIRPDGTVVTVFEAQVFGNISEMKFDAEDRLLFVSFSAGAVFASVNGEFPTELFPTLTNCVFLTVAPDGRILTSCDSGVVRVNASDGTLLNANFVQFAGRTSIEYGGGGGFGTGLLALEASTGTLYSVDEDGNKAAIGSGLVSPGVDADLAVGPCGELYVSRRQSSDVLRIRKPTSPDLNSDGEVDGADLGILLNAWGAPGCDGDLNGDGTVDGADLGILLNAWGPVR